jgi:hypothetical protein
MKTFAEKIIAFNKKLSFDGELPPGIRIMNPFRENEEALSVSSLFYKKFYNNNDERHLILGINPGRFGAGVTGVPFTDTRRLFDECGLPFSGKSTHEPSATFVYEVINAYGGTKKFYGDFYIHSICPLGFTIINDKGKEINYNYYDSRELTNIMYDFMISNIRKQINFGISTDVCFCFGTGKNEKFLKTVNEKYKFFKKIIPLEHPRFIMQYKSRYKQDYIHKYLEAFKEIKNEKK